MQYSVRETRIRHKTSAADDRKRADRAATALVEEAMKIKQPPGFRFSPFSFSPLGGGEEKKNTPPFGLERGGEEKFTLAGVVVVVVLIKKNRWPNKISSPGGR